MNLSAISLGLTRIYGAPFLPSSLFAAGEQGVLYDFSDRTTLFQDSAGTAPVTAVEQPVGLMLDKSKGLVLGSELVTNGDFSNGTTGWTARAGCTLSAVDGWLRLTYTGSGAARANFTTLTTVAGRTYKVLFAVRNTTSTTTAGFFAYSDAFATQIGASGSKTAAGSYEMVFTATSTTTNIEVGNSASNGGVGAYLEFDNISVRELPGNHAFQATSTSRPVLSARYNLLTKTEQINDVAWATSNATVVQNNAVAPDGTLTAATVTATGASAFCRQVIAGISSISVSGQVWLRRKTGTGSVFVYRGDGAGNDQIALTSTWARFTTGPVTGGAGTNVFGVLLATSGDEVEIWHPDLRVTNDAAGQPAYQRVNTATDYDTTGFKPYLRFDGTDDWMQTNSINFTGTDKMTVFAGVRKLSDAAVGTVVELAATDVGNNGQFALFAPLSETNISWRSKGTAYVDVAASPFAAPVSVVVTGIGNISGPVATIRANGVQAATSTATQGTGNYGNYPLYIGRRGGTTLPFNGRLYGLIVRGAQSTAQQITNTENWLNQRTGAF